MDREDGTATGANPTILLLGDEGPHTFTPDGFQVFQHAHAVLGPVAFIQLPQPGAGIAVTLVTVFGLPGCYIFTGNDLAGHTICGFQAVVTATAGTGIHIAGIGPAQAAVHAAGCDQPGGDGGGTFNHQVAVLLRLGSKPGGLLC